ncbi:hypothetical protein BgiBS90_032015, partial [Biomphalaria glabrata]
MSEMAVEKEESFVLDMSFVRFMTRTFSPSTGAAMIRNYFLTPFDINNDTGSL